MRVNLRRGLNRVFIVLAACWYVTIPLLLWSDWRSFIFGDVFDRIDPSKGRLILRTLAAVSLPLAVYALCWAIAWAVKGFQTPKELT